MYKNNRRGEGFTKIFNSYELQNSCSFDLSDLYKNMFFAHMNYLFAHLNDVFVHLNYVFAHLNYVFAHL